VTARELGSINPFGYTRWSGSNVPSSTEPGSDGAYCTAPNVNGHELFRGLASIAFGHAGALLFPATPSGAPRTEKQRKVQGGGKDVTDISCPGTPIPSSLPAGRTQPSAGTDPGSG
jgi:hypothetical protein